MVLTMMTVINTDSAALLAHLLAIKAQILAWVAQDPQNRWACYPTTEVAHWNQQGIFTVAQYEHHSLVCNAFESIRSAFGYKPSWSGLDSLSNEALQAEIDTCSRVVRAEIDAEQAEEAAHKAATEAAMAHQSGWAIGQLVSL